MNLNNNWIRNIDTGKWSSSIESLKKTDFDSLKQNIKSYRFYQKCLSGSTYVGINGLIHGTSGNISIDNVYDIIDTYTSSSYYYDSGLDYIEPFTGTLPDNPIVISSTTSQNIYLDKVITDYNLTLKNLFTPDRLINDQKDNIFYVDVATTQSLTSLLSDNTGLIIDGIRIIEGQRILVKDQMDIVTILSSVDPGSFFYGYYEIYEISGTYTKYKIPNSDNGIYIFQRKRLIRTNDIDSYEKLMRYSICVKLGNTNKEKQFKVKRLNSGFYPQYQINSTYPGGSDGESIYFEESHNFVLRQRVDYNNLYELSLQDTLKHSTQSFIVDISYGTNSGTVSYTIPERSLSIGEFGVIINDQDGISNIINSKYKSTLRSISQTTKNYWICGDDGLLLKVNKTDFSISKIDLDDSILTKLNSVSFFNDLRGVVVGNFNMIWVTSNGGYNWEQISLSDFNGYNYNKAVFTSIDKFYIGGDNGVFIEFEYNLGNWSAHKRRISKYIDGLDDEYLLVDNINAMNYFDVGTFSFLSIGCELNNLYLYDISNFISSTYSFLFIQDSTTSSNNFGDISSITYISSTSSIFFSTFNNIYQLDPISGYLSGSNSNILSTTFSIFITQSSINAIFNYNDDILYTGNSSLWKFTDFSTFSNVYDSTFFDRLKPRFLFLDYDMGSKLYWFDDYGQYRLPEKIEFPISYLQSTGTNSYIAFNQNLNSIYDANTLTTVTYSETNWITYWKDRSKTFEYYSNLNHDSIIEPSFTFSSSDAVGKTFSYNTSTVTTNYNDIINLMPSAIPPMSIHSVTQSSRFRSISGLDITTPLVNYDLYFYDYLGIWHLTLPTTDTPPNTGDVLEITSDVFEGKFVINKIYVTDSIPIEIGLPATSMFMMPAISVSNPIIANDYFRFFYDSVPISATVSATGSHTDSYSFLNEISDSINDYTISTGFSSYVTIGSPLSNSQLFIISPLGATYNGSYVTYSTSISTLGFILTPFSGGSDTTPGYDYYMYFYTDFNGNILNNIPSSTYGFTVRDLNKYPLDLNQKDYFIDNFNKHYISYAYSCEEVLSNFVPISSITQSFRIAAKYSQFSAYYNLQSLVEILDIDANTYSTEIEYVSSFLNFGYSPTYNLLSYLNFIDPSQYIPTKEFYSMPNWIDIPGPDSILTLDDKIFIDTGLETNKLRLGFNLKHIYDSLLIWTFVDVLLDSNLSQRLLIIDKYYDSTDNSYIIEFHDKLEYTISINIFLISIYSRRSLQEISDDLQYINRLQRPNWLESSSYDNTSTTITGTWSNYETNLNFKVPTDSYTKILLSDSSIVNNISSILYTDYKYEVAMQVNKLDKEFEYNVTNISISGSNYQFDFSEKHNLKDKDYIITSLIGTQSEYPYSILGYHNISYVNDYSILIPITSIGIFSLSNFKIKFVKKDYFFNFQPIDIFDLGIGDKKIKQSVEIKLSNYEIVKSNYNLINLDLNKYKFRLIDGLDLTTLSSNYSWILDAEISEAIIGKDKDGNLLWYKGNWHCGRWFGGTWISGTWVSGDWYYGNWSSKLITNNILSVKIDANSSNNYSSIWYGGRWFDGNWENGTWNDGRWYGGTWSNGYWYNGTWNDGTWNDGSFNGGLWILGKWNNGTFNTDKGQSYWLDGKFYGGDFENGYWYNGIFDEKNGLTSRFGTKSFNSRNSIWKSGKFLSGQFHSYMNIDDNGNPDISDVHKYSKWYTGVFNNGSFYGGIAYNINFKNATWYGGILEDIEITSINPTASEITLSGEFNFNINDEIWIVDDQVYGTFSVFGSIGTPSNYKILTSIYDSDLNTTTINTNKNLFSIGTFSGTSSNMRCVSGFENSTWHSGVWYNGVFKNGLFDGGLWYDGYFEGTFG